MGAFNDVFGATERTATGADQADGGGWEWIVDVGVSRIQIRPSEYRVEGVDRSQGVQAMSLVTKTDKYLLQMNDTPPKCSEHI